VHCPAALTGDGAVTFFDVSAFIQLFAGGDDGADWNSDGVFNFFDIFAYLQDFNAGCH